jgi:hypothetical protein
VVAVCAGAAGAGLRQAKLDEAARRQPAHQMRKLLVDALARRSQCCKRHARVEFAHTRGGGGAQLPEGQRHAVEFRNDVSACALLDSDMAVEPRRKHRRGRSRHALFRRRAQSRRLRSWDEAD